MALARLKEYKAKRNFRRTREPAGGRRRVPKIARPFFVVQKHEATRLHYDFRLEMEGVLKSWAVPKGFPVKRGDRRLAVQVEDHPVEYAGFEGTIPEGNYGAGTVMVWDAGSYQVKGGSPIRALESGKLHFTLNGKKLKGEWALVRMRAREHEDKPQWLLLKSGSDSPPLSARAEDRSVLTNRSLKRIASDNDAQWESNRVEKHSTKPPGKSRRETAAPNLKVALAGLPRRKAEFVEPMKAALVDELPRGSEWVYELKFDGVRALAIKRGRQVRLLSRNAKDLTAKFPGVSDALGSLRSDEAMLDGEIVALDAKGRPSFQLLQSANLTGESRPPVFYYVFDLIQLEGRDLAGLPLLERKAVAQALVANAPAAIRFSAGIQAGSGRVLRAMKARGLEGLIAKRKDSRYEIGRRSGAWVKFKWTHEQEFVIGGYTRPKGTRAHFGAILVGYFERGRLKFASKVGTGFDQGQLKTLHAKFQKLVRADCPFAGLPEKPGAGERGGLTLAEMRRCVWVEPTLVCQVRFGEWTRDHHLRQPAFLGLREDKRPRDVVRETPR